jgi:hypothetical protein
VPDQFEDATRRAKERLQRAAEQLVRGSARRIYAEMSSGGQFSPGTPIDIGFHRSHWDAKVGSLPDGGPAGSEGAAEQRVEDAVAGFLPGEILYLTNNGPAIRRLEFDAWSTQAPDGFVRPAVEAWQQIVSQVAEGIDP